MTHKPIFSSHSKSLAFLMAMLFAIFCLPYSMSALVCDTEADFTYSASGCEVDFTPSYSGPGTVVHKWEFDNTSAGAGPFSSTTVPSAHFTFDYTGGTSKYVKHTVTITLPGGAVVIKYCEKIITTTCTQASGCFTMYYFYYQVNGCDLTITYYNTPGYTMVWDFGDGTAPVTTSTLPTHTYTTSGTYIVTVNVNGKRCSMAIHIDCEGNSSCCSENFSWNLLDDCAILRLYLDADCESGSHLWTITPSTPGSCIDILNFYPTATHQNIQLTNINTSLIPSLIITHTVTCEDGTVHTKTINASFFVSGIFIGTESTSVASLTLLTDYNCVLPGSSYSGTLPVYVSGRVQIDKKFTFNSTNIFFEKGASGFDMLDFSYPLALTGCNLKSACGCLWRGLKLYNKGVLTCNLNSSGVRTIISDALYAINANNVSTSLTLDNTSFIGNFIGIKSDGPFGFFSMKHVIFDGSGPGGGAIKDICDLTVIGVEAPFGAGLAGGGGAYPGAGTPGYQPLFPVTFGTQKGFAGMYMLRTPLNLGIQVPPQQNEFSNLAYGIIAYDGSTTITQNSTFSNINATDPGLPYSTYQINQTGGILFMDRTLHSIDNFNFTGYGNAYAGVVDFANCDLGIEARSEQPSMQTPVNIMRASMSDVHTGIFLDARFNGGNFIGKIQQNTIDANLTLYSNLMFDAGIVFADFSNGLSKVDVSDNVVRMGYSTMSGGGSVGIVGRGLTVPAGTGNVELDIHDNRVTLNNGAENGIGLDAHPNGWIRNNTGATNGVFIQSGNSWSGIGIHNSSTNNLVACNQVVVSPLASCLPQYGLLDVLNSQFGGFYQNLLSGAGNGAHFRYDCMKTNFRCNDMTDNTVGLLYDYSAKTGDQGTPSLSYGNRWNSTISGAFSGGGAICDLGTVLPGLSKYFVRNVVNEIPPPPVVPAFGSVWFFLPFPNPSVDCGLSSCPAPAPTLFEDIPPYRLDEFDTLVARRSTVLPDVPFAEEQAWQYEYDLWELLNEHPDLVQGNTVMQNFLSELSGSSIEDFWDFKVAMKNTLVPDANLLATFQSNMNTIRQTEDEINALDSLLHIATDSVEIATLLEQVAVKNGLLNEQILIQENASAAFDTQRTSAIGDRLEQLAAITANNICESNLRRAYEIYLQTVSSDLGIDSISLADLKAIATQCPNEGGPGVFVARALHKGITGILPDLGSCDPTAERKAHKLLKSSALSVSPNPNQGGFVVNIPTELTGKQILLRILDARGSVVRTMSVDGESVQVFDLVNEPNGLYFISLHGGDVATGALPFIIQH